MCLSRPPLLHALNDAGSADSCVEYLAHCGWTNGSGRVCTQCVALLHRGSPAKSHHGCSMYQFDHYCKMRLKQYRKSVSICSKDSPCEVKIRQLSTTAVMTATPYLKKLLQPNLHDCHELCLSLPACLFGTYYYKTGECLLSHQTVTVVGATASCSEPCVSFDKLLTHSSDVIDSSLTAHTLVHEYHVN